MAEDKNRDQEQENQNPEQPEEKTAPGADPGEKPSGQEPGSTFQLDEIDFDKAYEELKAEIGPDTETREKILKVREEAKAEERHLEKVKRMVEEGYDCSEVLVQLAAVRSALDNAGKVILQDHMRHCMVDAVAAGDMSAIEDLCQAVEKFIK